MIAIFLVIIWRIVSENSEKTAIVNTTSAVVPFDAKVNTEEKKRWSLLRDIISCESGARWEVTEIPGGLVIGPCRLNTQRYATTAKSKGYNLYSPSHNMRFCLDLFEQSYSSIQLGGDSPWNGTRHCWENRQRIRIEQARVITAISQQ